MSLMFHFFNMDARLSTLLILTTLPGTHSITTVSKVSVKSGSSVTVPCLYESKYKSHVKYLCEGRDFSACLFAARTNKPGGTGRFLISDNKQQRTVTVSITGLTLYWSYYWCAVEVNEGHDVGARFQLSVTTGRPQLFVDHQEVTGFIGEDVTVNCHYTVGGENTWCRLGGSCVKEPRGLIEGITVTIIAAVPDVFSVTLIGLRTRSSGWYYCAKGGLQMPVHVTVSERPGTTGPTEQRTTLPTKSYLNTFNTKHQPVTHTSVFENEELTTAQAESHSVYFNLKTFSIRLCVSLFIMLVGLFIWFILKRLKRTTAKTSAATSLEEEVTYSNLKAKRETSDKTQRSCADSDVEEM